MTHLHQMMLHGLQRRNYSPNTIRSRIDAVEKFARYCCRSPGQFGARPRRKYQVHLFRDHKLSPHTFGGRLRLCGSWSSRGGAQPRCRHRMMACRCCGVSGPGAGAGAGVD